jgi:hypothetical protein
LMDDSVFWLTPISFLWSAVAVEQDESPDSVRPDHGSTGAYSSWPSWAAAGTAAADGNWSRGLEMLRMFSAVVQLGPYGQACVAKFLFMPAVRNKTAMSAARSSDLRGFIGWSI